MKKEDDPRIEQYIGHVNEISQVPSYYATVFTVTLLPSGMLRLTYGDQLTVMTKPAYHAAFTSSIDQMKALHELIGKMIEGHETETKRMAEETRMQ